MLVLQLNIQTGYCLRVSGVSVAADSQEGAQVDAANKRYTALLQAKEASYQFATAEAQTLPAMRKHKEVGGARVCPTKHWCMVWIFHFGCSVLLFE